jgi:hypothetical protein
MILTINSDYFPNNINRLVIIWRRGVFTVIRVQLAQDTSIYVQLRNEPSGSTIGGGYLDHMSDYQLVMHGVSTF